MVSRGSGCHEFSTRLVTLRVQVRTGLRPHLLENLAGISVTVHNSVHNEQEVLSLSACTFVQRVSSRVCGIKHCPLLDT
jgi:hypothetical protein